ncbi:hypothetical protein SDC9_54088 [bioreactor metagenome]|uniref:Uncharacterized protein n=1 Tax=bioreactor metagenome TaxID=1076179 RepID=A0A644WV73_9ZZZZ
MGAKGMAFCRYLGENLRLWVQKLYIIGGDDHADSGNDSGSAGRAAGRDSDNAAESRQKTGKKRIYQV